MTLGGGGLGVIVTELKIGKWSEGEISEWVILGERCESLLVMTRSRVWPLLLPTIEQN